MVLDGGRAFFGDTNGVHGIDSLLRDVNCQAHVLLMDFVGDRFEYVRIFAGQSGHLYTVDSLALPLANYFGSSLSARESRIVGIGSPEGIDVHARSDDC